MIKITLKPQWTFHDDQATQYSLTGLIALCAGIHETQSLSVASRQLGLSYRHTWGLIRDATRIFGAPVATLQQGRGAKLTALGEKLLWADRRINARLTPLLDTLASELEADLARELAHTSGIVRMNASHGFAIEALREQLIERGIPVELKYVGSQEAVASLTQAECDLAGFHVPLGALQVAALPLYAAWLKLPGYALIHLATRQQGLMVAPNNPKRIRGLQDLTRKGIRFINRQAGSGTRVLLDLLIAREKIDRKAIQGYEVSEFTHAAIAAYVASGMADVGFGVETGARRFHLDFIPVASERYFLMCREDRLDSKPIADVVSVLRSDAFLARVNALTGYNATDCGRVINIKQAFPSLIETTAKKSKSRSTN